VTTHILHPLIMNGETISLCVHSSHRPLEVLLSHKNGRCSDFPFQSLWMDRENQKHGLALQSMRTSQVLIIVFICKCHFITFVRYNTLCSLLPSSLATSSPSATQNSSPLCTSTITESRATTPNTLQSLVRQRKGFTFRWLINLKFLEARLTFRWERNAHNIIESPKFHVHGSVHH
jgi:hypothetical protein